MKPTYQDIKATAQYRWPEIHAALGIDQRYLKNKHQPCPACGGKDRFRYDDKDGNGIHLQPLQQQRWRWFRLGNALFRV